MPSLPAWLTFCIAVAAVLTWVSVAALTVLAFAEQGYNWDLDHEMYFGSRLLAGELIWTREFHDKLPFNQILFAVPAWFGSVQAWRAISLALCLGAALSLVRMTPRAFVTAGLTQREYRWVAAFGAGMFMAFVMALPGRISVVNPAATSLAMMAVLAILADLRGHGRGGAAAILLAALAAAAAISLRPYFLAPVALAVAWGAVRPVVAGQASVGAAVSRALLWGGAIGLWGLILNVGPYLLTGELRVVRPGLSALASDIYDRSAWKVFLDMIEDRDLYISVLWMAFAGIGAVFVLSARPRARTVPGVLFVYASVAVLLGFTVAQRWWQHYSHFFSAYFGLLMILIGAWLSEGRHWPGLRTPVRALAALGVLVLSVGLAWFAWRDIDNAVPAADDGRAAILATFVEYRERTGQKDVPFLAPAQVFLHWKLGEPRWGFPHSANTRHILLGWWQSVPAETWVPMPSDLAGYCDLMWRQGPAMIVLTRFTQFVPCLEEARSPYRLEATLPLPQADPMRIYLRDE